MKEQLIFGPEPVLFSPDFSGSEQFGFLVSTQLAANIPFLIKRVFWSFGVPEDLVKGNHAHRQDLKVLIAVKGTIEIQTETSQNKTYILNSPFQALYVPAYCWIKLRYATGSILVALSSTEFDEQDYIRDYHEFKLLRQQLQS